VAKKKHLAKLSTHELLQTWKVELEKNRRETIAEKLEEGRRELLERNNRLVILDAMDFCLRNNVPFPHWLTDAFHRAMLEVGLLKRSWTDVFGDPVPKADKRKKQLEALKLRTRLNVPVYLKVREYQLQNKAVDFHQIAAEIPGATESIVKRIYYSGKKNHDVIEAMLRICAHVLREAERKTGRGLKADLVARVKGDYNEAIAEVFALIFSQKIEDF